MPRLQLILEDSFAFLSINSVIGLQKVLASLLELCQNQYRGPDSPAIKGKELPRQWEPFITCKGRLKPLHPTAHLKLWGWLPLYNELKVQAEMFPDTRLQMRWTTLSRLGCSVGYGNTPRKLTYSWKVDYCIIWTWYAKPSKLQAPATFNLLQKLPLSNLLVIPLTTSSEAHSFSFIFYLLQKYYKKQKSDFFFASVSCSPINVSVTQQNLTLILVYLKAFPLFSEYCAFFFFEFWTFFFSSMLATTI